VSARSWVQGSFVVEVKTCGARKYYPGERSGAKMYTKAHILTYNYTLKV
jgi:hypothetical protein